MSDDSMALGYALGQDSNGGGNNGGGFFGNEGLWAVIILAIIFGGLWGGNGNGNNGGGAAQFLPYAIGGNGAVTRSDLCSEFNFNGLENAVRGISQGICDSTFALNNTVVNGFNGVSSAICNLGYEQAQLHNATQMAMMQNQSALQTQIAQCCCDNRAALADLKYDMATSDCSIKTLVNQLAQQIMWGQQNGIRDLSDLINNKFCQMEMSQKDAVIADLRTQLAQCGDQNMANAIVARLTAVINPPAVPAYPAANPNGCGSWPASFLSCNNGWNNGCNQGCGSCC